MKILNIRNLIITVIGAAFIASVPLFVYARVPNDPSLNQIGGLELLQLPQAWDITQGTSNVVVAVIDAGVDINNPDLAENIWTNPSERIDGIDNDGDTYIDDVHGWNFVDNNNDVRPRSAGSATSTSRVGINHGSVIAGIIGAVGNNGIGGSGVNWHVKLMPLKILDDRGDGDTDLAVKAIDYAIQKKANIINLSFVGPTPSLDFIQAVRRAYRAGILVVAAGGNGSEGAVGVNLDNIPQYPVCFDDPLKEENWVIGVAALDARGLLAPFSNYGSRCIDLSAPGYRLPSTELYDPSTGRSEIYGGSWSGTSIAAPFVSGVAALVKSVQPAWGPDQIRKAILSTVDPIPGNVNHDAGLGSVNAYKAVRYAKQGGDGGLPTGFYIAPVKTARGTIAHIFDTQFKEIKSATISPLSVNAKIVTADFDNAGIAQIVAAVPDRKGSLVRIFQRDGKFIREFRPFGSAERGDMSIVSVDVNGDGADELFIGSSKLHQAIVVDGTGKRITSISIPEQSGAVSVTAARSLDQIVLVTAVQKGGDIKTYSWNAIGSFVSFASTTTQTSQPISIGFIPTSMNVPQLYIAQQNGAHLGMQFFSPDGVLLNSFTTQPSGPGTLFGYVFGRLDATDETQLIIGTVQSGSVIFETVDVDGTIVSSIKSDSIKPLKYLNLYFGK